MRRIFIIFTASIMLGSCTTNPADFGHLSLGAKMDWAGRLPEVPKGYQLLGIPLGECAPYDCEILGKDGIRYLVFGDIITRKRVLREEARSSMPFGLYSTRSKQKAVKIVENAYKIKLKEYDRNMFSGVVNKNEEGFSYFIYMTFAPDGLVNEFGISLGETG
jgi:hypothetical protein